MGWFDKVGKAAMDAVDAAVKVSSEVKQRVDPLVDKSPVAQRVRDRLVPSAPDATDTPTPESNASPFAPPPTETTAEAEEAPPLADATQAAQVFGGANDPWTHRTRQLLDDRNVAYAFVDLEGEDTPASLEGRLVRETGQQRAPYVFLRGDFIGGFNALDELARLGLLEDRVLPPEARSAAGGRTRIVVPSRAEDAAVPGERLHDDRK
ncbi:MAG: glutaredoxin [Myxococcota bacterium]